MPDRNAKKLLQSPMDVEVKKVYGYFKGKNLVAALFDKSFGFCMIRKLKYRGEIGMVLNCSYF